MRAPKFTAPLSRPEAVSATRALLPIMGVVLAAYLVIGLAMSVHVQLRPSTLLVVVVAGSQFGTALLSRPWAGYFADSRGPKLAVVVGLLVAAGSGPFCWLAYRFAREPTTAAG